MGVDVIKIPGMVQQIEDSFKKFLPVATTKLSVDALAKELTGMAETIKGAEKTSADMAKIKNDAAVTKKKTDLDAKLKDAKSKYATHSGELKNVQALLTKEGEAQKKEAQLVADIEKFLPTAKKTKLEMAECGKKTPSGRDYPSKAALQKAAQTCGSSVTTAESVSSSLEGFVTKGKSAGSTNAKNVIAEADKLRKELDADILKCRATCNKFLKLVAEHP